MEGEVIGRIQIHDWNKDSAVLLGFLSKKSGVDVKDYDITEGAIDNKAMTLFDVIDSGSPDTLILRYVGHPLGKSHCREIQDYFSSNDYWTTSKEMGELLKRTYPEMEIVE